MTRIQYIQKTQFLILNRTLFQVQFNIVKTLKKWVEIMLFPVGYVRHG